MPTKPSRLISLGETCTRVGLSRWSIRKKIVEGCFPKPVVVGHRATKFVEAEIEQWIGSLVAERERS